MIAAMHREVASNEAPSPAIAPNWKLEWRDSFTQVGALLEFLQLDAADFTDALALDGAATFPLRVPLSFAARMAKADPHDPLLAQVLPKMAERLAAVNFVSDPVNDLQHTTSVGVIHKYRSRVLLIAAGTCAVNCRYCFRREFPYAQASLSASALADAVRYIAAHAEINEVILSGGDPLALDNLKLARMADALLALPQIKRLRVHTRTPIVLPARIDAEFLHWTAGLKVPLVIVLHSNHANEWLDETLLNSMRALKRAGVTLLNQAVLLRGVNDSAKVQVALSEALFAAGVLPYYLNLLDPVAGSAHFEVSEMQAQQIYRQMAAALPGFLLPKLVRDVSGLDAKQLQGLQPVQPLYLARDAAEVS